MKLLTVTHFYEAHGGGIERVAGRMNRELAALGHETMWAASGEGDLPGAETARVVPLACWNIVERLTGLPVPIPGFGALRRLGQAVRAADGVIIHDALYASSIAAMIAAKRAGKPVLMVQHVADIPLSGRIMRGVIGLANRLVARPMLRAADRLVFISDTVRRHFASVRTKAPPLLLFNGVDTAVFRPGARATGSEGRTILFVGRFVEKKGLAIIERVARARPDWRFVLAGKGPIDPRRWGLSNVAVAEGRSGESLADLYRAADLLLLPSVGEGYPLVVQEAMACGLPVVCGAETAEADPAAGAWLHGVEVSLADPDGSAARVLAVADRIDLSPDQRAAMSAYAAATYDWRRMAAYIGDALTASRTSQPAASAAAANRLNRSVGSP